MGRTMRRAAGLLCLFGLCSALSAQAQDAHEVHLQLFSTVDRPVAAVGESFVLEVEAYASPPSEAAAGRLRQAFEQARPSLGGSRLELVRIDSVQADGVPPVLILSRRYVFRAQQAGAFTVPPVAIRIGAEVHETAVHAVDVYAITPAFFETTRSILPVVAESTSPGTRRPSLRVGSAFLVAPDALVTSFHVVVDAHRVRVALPDGQRVTIKKAWALDPVRDVAVLAVDPEKMEEAGVVPLRLVSTTGAVTPPGERHDAARVVFTNGWPQGVRHSTAGRRYGGVMLEPREPLWISANPVRPGDSGGPLLDAYGRVLGVVTAGSVLTRGEDVLRENVCVATDPRPALLQKLLADRPRSLRSFFRDEAFMAQPHVQGLRLSAMLGGRRQPARLAEQLAAFEAALAQAQEDAGLLFLRGAIYQRLGTGAEAAAAFRAALTVFENYFPAAYMLAIHHLQQKAYAQAEHFFEYTRRFRPYQHMATYGVARGRMGRLQYAAAIVPLREVLRYNPTFAPAVFDLALCYFALGDTARVAQVAVKLDRVDPAWGRRLQRVLRNPALHPAVLDAQPRAGLPASSLPAARVP